MQIALDFHIHSCHSCDSASLPMADLPPAAAEAGLVEFGISDHLHTPYNLPDLVASRQAFDALPANGRFHFGAEISCVSRWELEEISQGRADQPIYGLRQGGPVDAELAIGLTEQDIADLGIEYVIGGTHWPMYVELEPETVRRDYHRQNMFLVTHPLVDVLAHPWWWMGKWQESDGSYNTEPWLADFGSIPQSMHEELAAAAIEHGTAIEINVEAMLLNGSYPERFRRQYVEYLAWLQQRGVTLSIGSDCHSPSYRIRFAEAAEMLTAVGVTGENLWRPGRR